MYDDFFGPSLSMGTGFYPTYTDYGVFGGYSGGVYGDREVSGNLSSYLPVHVNIHGVGSSGINSFGQTINTDSSTAPYSYMNIVGSSGFYPFTGLAQLPPPTPFPTTPAFQMPVLNLDVPTVKITASDIIGGVMSFSSSALTTLANNAGHVAEAVGKIEAQVVNHVVNAPAIVTSVISLGQVINSYLGHDNPVTHVKVIDDKGVYTNGANFLVGVSTTELAVFVGRMALGTASIAATPLVVSAAAIAIGATSGIIAAQYVGDVYNDWKAQSKGTDSIDFGHYFLQQVTGNDPTGEYFNPRQVILTRSPPPFDRYANEGS